MDTNNREGLAGFIRVLKKLVADAEADGGKTYDDLAERIRQRSADGLIEEAIGYLPEGTETPPEGGCQLTPQKWDRGGQDVRSLARKLWLGMVAAKVDFQNSESGKFRSPKIQEHPNRRLL
jgi:hypothetical protein